MFQQRIFITRLLAVCAILMANVPVAFARDDTGKVYRCETKDAVSIQKDGTLSKLLGEAALKPFDKIVIDVESGHITYPLHPAAADLTGCTRSAYCPAVYIVPSREVTHGSQPSGSVHGSP